MADLIARSLASFFEALHNESVGADIGLVATAIALAALGVLYLLLFL